MLPMGRWLTLPNTSCSVRLPSLATQVNVPVPEPKGPSLTTQNPLLYAEVGGVTGSFWQEVNKLSTARITRQVQVVNLLVGNGFCMVYFF